MAPTNSKTVHQTSFTPYREQPRSTRIVVAYPRPAFSATNRTNTFQSVLINNSKFLKATHRTKIRKIEIPRSMVVEALSCCWSRRASQHPAVTKPCASLKKPLESCPFAAPCGPRRKKNDRGQRSAFPSETSRFALSILAHRGSALPWLVNDRAALRLRHLSPWCDLLTLVPLCDHVPDWQPRILLGIVEARSVNVKTTTTTTTVVYRSTTTESRSQEGSWTDSSYYRRQRMGRFFIGRRSGRVAHPRENTRIKLLYTVVVVVVVIPYAVCVGTYLSIHR